jgi:hypothetical protein
MSGFVQRSNMNLRILYHGHCFDGVASATVFTRFYLAKINPAASVGYHGVMHRPGNLFDEAMFDGDENAIVDFKYSASDKLTWWFDHHQSAFLTPQDEAHFRGDTTGRKFLDTESKSCTEFIARVAREKFGFADDRLASLIHWARVIDGALYDSAAQCVELAAPALQLMQVIESVPEEDFIEEIIRRLVAAPLEEVAQSEFVQSRFRPILEQHRRTLDLMRRRARYADGVVQFDLLDDGLAGFNKFIPYYLHPEATYSVALTRSPQRTKISIGSNPWAPRPRRHNIATICERYGGGGHAVVGAVSLGTDETERARQAVCEVVTELST